MGEVYLARDSRLNRNVALKILPSDSVQDAIRKRRFTQEARAASALNHPNILTIHDFGTLDGISYLVSELVEGESLRKVIARGPVPIRRLLDLGIQIADGLAAAHQTGIVHRDLKPENIMVTPGGRVKILDFGLAKPMDLSEGSDAVTSDGERTQPGLILGTVGYMSPEQARGLPLSLQSDQFALGIILHEMATGQHPFRRETPMQTLLEIAKLSNAPFTPGPVAFRLLVARCLSREPSRRFESTAEILDRLKRISDELPERGRPGKEARRAPLRPRIWRFRAPLLLALAAVSIFCLGVLATHLMRPGGGVPDLSKYEFTPVAARSTLTAFPALSPNGNAIAYSADSDGVLQIFTQPLKSPFPTALTHGDEDCLFPFWAPDSRRVYYISRNALWSIGASGGSPELMFEHVARAAVSPDGRRFAILHNDTAQGESYSLWFADFGAAAKRYNMGSFGARQFRASSYLSFARDGRLGVWTSEDNGSSQFWVITDPQTPPKRYLNKLSRAPLARMFGWTHDAAHVVYGERSESWDDNHLWLADLRTGARREITAGIGRELAPSLSPGSDRVAFASVEMSYSVDELSLKQEPAAHNITAGILPFSEMSPAWSPAGTQYAYVTDRSGDPEIWMRDTGSGWERRLVSSKDFPDRSRSLRDLAFSPDGQRLAFTRNAEHAGAIWVATLNGEAPLRIAHDDLEVLPRYPAWSPDGNWIAYSVLRAGDYGLIKARADGSGTALPVRANAGMKPAWSPRGDTIATIADTGLLLIDASGRASRHAGEGTWLSITWSNDGRGIYGIRRNAHRKLELASLDPTDGTESVRQDLGRFPAAFSYAAAMGIDPVLGASISSDGRTFLTSAISMKSSLWLLSGYTQ